MFIIVFNICLTVDGGVGIKMNTRSCRSFWGISALYECTVQCIQECGVTLRKCYCKLPFKFFCLLCSFHSSACKHHRSKWKRFCRRYGLRMKETIDSCWPAKNIYLMIKIVPQSHNHTWTITEKNLIREEIQRLIISHSSGKVCLFVRLFALIKSHTFRNLSSYRISVQVYSTQTVRASYTFRNHQIEVNGVLAKSTMHTHTHGEGISLKLGLKLC